MAVLASRIPGFGLVHGNNRYAARRSKVLRTLSLFIPEKDILRLEKLGLVRFVGHAELMGETARYCTSLFYNEPPAFFDPVEQTVWVNLSQADNPQLECKFVACLGIDAALGNPRYASGVKESIRRLTGTSWEDHDFSLYTAACDALWLNGRNDLTASLLHWLVCEGLYENPDLADQVKSFNKCFTGKKKRKGKQDDSLDAVIEFAVAVARDQAKNATKFEDPILRDKVLEGLNKKVFPLSCHTKVTQEKLPSGAWFLKTDKRLQIKGKTEPYFGRITDPGITMRDLWDRTNDEIIDEFAAKGFKEWDELASLDLRPSTRLHALASCVDSKAKRLWFLKHLFVDLGGREMRRSSLIPSYVADLAYPLRLTGARVGKNLDWALLEVAADPERRVDTFTALATGWHLQADALKTGIRYQAGLSFWIHQACRADEPAGKAVVSCRGQDTQLPLSLITVRVTKLRRLGIVSRVVLTEVTGKWVSRDGNVSPLKLILTESDLNSLGAVHKGDLLECTGLFMISGLSTKKSLQKEQTFAQISLLQQLPIVSRARHLRTLFCDTGSAELAFELADVYRRLGQRKKSGDFLDFAANHGHAGASMVLAFCKIEENNGVVGTEAVQYLGAALHADPGMTFVFFPRMQSLHGLPAGLVFNALNYCAFKLANSSALYEQDAWLQARRTNETPEDSKYSEILHLNLLNNAFYHGAMPACNDLIRAYALGEGVAQDPNRAMAICTRAVFGGYMPAQFWLFGMSDYGADFFRMSRQQHRDYAIEGVQGGNPAKQLLLALYYMLEGKDEPNADLIVNALFDWVTSNLHDREFSQATRRFREQLSPQQLEALKTFDVWKELGIEQPPAKIPLLEAGTVSIIEAELHPEFLQCLDPDAKNGYTEKLKSQVEFFNENSLPAKLGYAADHPEIDPVEGLELRAFNGSGTDTDEAQGLLLLAARGSEQHRDICSIYPFMRTGTALRVHLQSSLVSQTQAAAVLVGSTDLHNGETIRVHFFDPLWPLMRHGYYTGEQYVFTMYGIALTIKENTKGPGYLNKNRPKGKKLPDHFVYFVAQEGTEAVYYYNSPLFGIERNAVEVAGVRFARLSFVSFAVKDPKKGLFTVYVPEQYLENMGELTIGKRYELMIELDGYATALAETDVRVLN